VNYELENQVSKRSPYPATTSYNQRPLPNLKTERRRDLRHTMILPVKVAGTDSFKRQWSELGKTLNVSSGGVALMLSKKVLNGDILFLELPLPARFRKDNGAYGIYYTYVRVRYVEMRGAQQIVRAQFLRQPSAS